MERVSQIIPSLKLCLNQKSREFVIVHYAFDRLFSFNKPSGAIQRISEEELRIEGLKIILKSLTNFPYRIPEPSEFQSMLQSMGEAFEIKHKQLWITLHKGTEIWIEPIQLVKLACRNETPIATLKLCIPCSEKEFLFNVFEAFEIEER